MKPVIKHVYVHQDSAHLKTETVYKMDALLTHIVKIVTVQTVLKYVFNVLPQLTEYWLSHNMLVYANKDSMNQMESVKNAPLVALNVQVPLLVIDALYQLLLESTEFAHAQQVISLPLIQSDSVKDVMITVYNVLPVITVIYVYLAFLLLLMVNAFVQEEIILTKNFNVSIVLEIVLYAQVKKFVLFVTQDSIFKMEFALEDVTLDSIFLELSVKNAKKDVNSVKELEHAQYANQEDIHSTDYATLIVLKDLLPIILTILVLLAILHVKHASNIQANV